MQTDTVIIWIALLSQTIFIFTIRSLWQLLLYIFFPSEEKPFSFTWSLCHHTFTYIYFWFVFFPTCSKFRLSYCPLRLNTFSTLLKGIFGEDARHQVFGDFEPLGQVEVPAYYVHMIWKATNEDENGLEEEWSTIHSLPSSECQLYSFEKLLVKTFNTSSSNTF